MRQAKTLPLELTPATLSAVSLAADLVRSPRVLNSFLAASACNAKQFQPAADMLASIAQETGFAAIKDELESFPSILAAESSALINISTKKWAMRFRAAFRNPEFVEFLNVTLYFARRHFPAKAKPPFMIDNDGRPVLDDPIAQAIERGCHRLLADPDEPRWLALSIFCLARIIAVNTARRFEMSEWDELTLATIDLEKTFLAGSGAVFARRMLQVNQDFFERRLPEYIGEHMFQGLLEAAINAPDTAFFH
jgi:hypothetical protein